MTKIKNLVFRNKDGYSNRSYVGTVFDPLVDKINELVEEVNLLKAQNDLHNTKF